MLRAEREGVTWWLMNVFADAINRALTDAYRRQTTIDQSPRTSMARLKIEMFPANKNIPTDNVIPY